MTETITNRIDALLTDRQTHLTALEAIDGKLGAIQTLLVGSAVAPKKLGRPVGSKKPIAAVNGSAAPSDRLTLAGALEMVLRAAGKPLAIADLCGGIAASAYKSKAKDLRPIVSLAVTKDARFKRVDRGIYSLA